MRRRRQTLQVSTFPFLAVLLCAMGSLILLLLVIDRRAKVVARAKAMQAAQHLEEEDAQKEAARKAELEQRRLALHALLAQQAEEVQAQVQAVQQKANDAGRDLQTEEARSQELLARLREEAARLSEKETGVAVRRTKLAQTGQQTEAARAELVKMTEELEQLEQAVADLKALRQRQQQTYSLVPYKGKQGDNRKPLYVECTAHGLIFHPDRTALEGVKFSAAEVRAEVQKRILQQGKTEAVAGKTSQKPYLLMLVRPDGIASYYGTLRALEDVELDFGYEFIE
ncbi:MAG: hypothetical protein JO112_15940, partial [Planctomycetes bacterium]|nr:hypothetical protein [Planctomycetota bacterium]